MNPTAGHSAQGTRFHWFLVLGAVMLAATAFLLLEKLWDQEPVYQGKRASTWLHEFALMTSAGQGVPFPPGVAPGGQPAVRIGNMTTNLMLWAAGIRGTESDPTRAFQAMGTNAILYLIRGLSSEDSFQVRTYRALYYKLPPTLNSILPSPGLHAFQIRQASVKAMGEMRILTKPAVDSLLELTIQPDRDMKAEALRALQNHRFRDNALQQPIAEWLAAARITPGQSYEIIKALKLSHPKAASILTELLVETNTTMRSGALRCLEGMGTEAAVAVPAMAAALDDPDHEVRYRAARALEAVGPAAADALPRLIVAIEDENQMVQTVARRTISNLEKLSPR